MTEVGRSSLVGRRKEMSCKDGEKGICGVVVDEARTSANFCFELSTSEVLREAKSERVPKSRCSSGI